MTDVITIDWKGALAAAAERDRIFRERIAAADEELRLLREVAGCAEFTLIEQRREFARGDIGDLDALEDALNAWKRSVNGEAAR